VFGDVGLLSGRVRRGRLSVGMCSASSAYCRAFSVKSGLCRDVFGEVLLVSGRVRRNRISVGTCPAKSA